MSDDWTDTDTGLPINGEWQDSPGCSPGKVTSTVDSVIITGKPGGIASAENGKKLWEIVLHDGTATADFRIDRYDDSGAVVDSPMTIQRASGVVSFHDPVMLAEDPAQPMEAATKAYVDAHTSGVEEAPMDNTTYGRDNGAWVALPANYIPEAPGTSQIFGRMNSVWTLVPIQADAPSDGSAYARQNGAWTAATTGGPYLPLTGGALSGPLTINGPNSLVLNGAVNDPHSILGRSLNVMRWQMQLGDSTPEGTGNAGANFSLTAFGTAGASLGTWLSIARADGSTVFNGSGVTINGGLSVNGVLALAGPSNLAIYGGTSGQVLTTNGVGILSWTTPSGGGGIPEAPTDGQLYGRKSSAWAVVPAGGGGIADAPNDGTAYARKSAAWSHLTHTDITDWTATLAPYALTTSVPVASSTTPLMNGTAAVGTGTTWARADHVHPTDTSRAAASALAGYLPLTGGGLSGSLAISPGSGTALLDLSPSPGYDAGIRLYKGSSGRANFIDGFTGGSLRWQIVPGNQTAETGSNAGSDFAINRFNDAGSLIDSPLTINRASGATTLTAPLTVSIAGAGYPLILTTPSAANGIAIIGKVNGKSRWEMDLCDGTAESGSNAGSNFGVYRYNDAGTLIDNPLSINRASGALTTGPVDITGVFPSGANQNYALAIDGPATKGAYVRLNASASATGIGITGQVASKSRWFMLLGDSSAESGSNAGSDFHLERYTDAGAYIDNPFTVRRSDGAAIFTGAVNVPQLNATWVIVNPTSGDSSLGVYSNSVNKGQFSWQASTGYVLMYNAVGGGMAWLQTDTNFVINGNGYKPSGGSWAASSDARIKAVESDYSDGLDAILGLRPVRYRYLGNDTPTNDVNAVSGDEAKPTATEAPYPASPHRNVATAGKTFVGLIAQEVEAVMPGMVTKRRGFIDGEEVADFRDLDTSELIYALVNAVKTLSARIEVLEGAPSPKRPSKGKSDA